MPRIAGVDLPISKKIKIALTSIYGVGRSNVESILFQAKVDGEKRTSELSSDEVSRLQKVIESQVQVEGDLRQKVRESIERLKRIGSYRGIRHARQLPVRGQRTRTNARTLRGKRRTVDALSKEMATKLEETKKG